jgi:putative endonuclease
MDGAVSKMSDWHVYIIRCAGNTLYTGITTDVVRRFQEHQGANGKGAKYLKGRGPLTLVWQYQARDRSHASRIEYAIKQLGKTEKEQMISGDKSLLKIS